MDTVTITRSSVTSALLAESTNAARTFTRNDGVSEFEGIVIDGQADQSLNGAWREANAKLTERMHLFITGSNVSDSEVFYVFASEPPGMVADNIRMYIVDYMMQDWLASVRPDYRQRYIDRANFEMDDLLRKLYRKNAPDNTVIPIDPGGGGGGGYVDVDSITNQEIDNIVTQ